MNTETKLLEEMSLSSSVGDYLSPEELQVREFVKSMLKGRLFIGNFQEKRLVANLKAYRDVIVVSKDEHDLLHDLEVVRKRIASVYKGRWIGITTPDIIGAPATHCLWVELPEEVFGSYWYKIKTVKFRDQEVLLKIAIVRPVNKTTADASNIENVDHKKVDDDTKTEEDNEYSFTDFKKALKDRGIYVQSAAFAILKDVVTYENTKDAVIFLSVLLMAIGASSVKLMHYIAEYSLRLLHEVSGLIRAVTPFFVACIDMVGKLIGACLILFFGSGKKAPPAYNVIENRNPQVRTITYDPRDAYYSDRPHLHQRFGKPVQITELN